MDARTAGGQVRPPEDLAVTLKESEAAQRAWNDLSDEARRRFIAELDACTHPLDRARRLEEVLRELMVLGTAGARR